MTGLRDRAIRLADAIEAAIVESGLFPMPTELRVCVGGPNDLHTSEATIQIGWSYRGDDHRWRPEVEVRGVYVAVPYGKQSTRQKKEWEERQAHR